MEHSEVDMLLEVEDPVRDVPGGQVQGGEGGQAEWASGAAEDQGERAGG